MMTTTTTIHPTRVIQHEIAVSNISLPKITRGNYLKLTELSEFAYANAALIAGEVKEQTTAKNAKGEPE